jgi:hypothetical protein
MELLGPASGAVANDCTTRPENTHGTEFRENLYPWHPWFGLHVGVHQAVVKPDGVVFRCSLRGRRLEVPAWMFDRSVCARVQAAEAHVEGIAHILGIIKLDKALPTSRLRAEKASVCTP